MKKKVICTARRGSKRVKGISREVRVLDLHSAYGISNDALSTLMVMANPHKNAHLFYKVCNSLRGFDPHMQNVIVEALALFYMVCNCLRGFDPRMQGEIVEALAMFYTGEAFTITCIEHVDELLVNLYGVFDRLLLNNKK